MTSSAASGVTRADGEDYRARLVTWLRDVALFSSDPWLASNAREQYTALVGQEPKL